jgi:hypothetical protein
VGKYGSYYSIFKIENYFWFMVYGKGKLCKTDNFDDKKQTQEIETCGMNGRGMTTTRKSALLHFYY